MRELAAVRLGLTLAITAALAAAALAGAISGAKAQSLEPVQGSARSSALLVSGPSLSWVVSRAAAGPTQFGAANAGFGGAGAGGPWRGLVWPPMSGGGVDRLAIASGDGVRGPDGQVLLIGRFGDADGLLGRRADSVISRDWPGAVRLKTGAFGFDISPRAGLGRPGGGGGSQTAGALLRFGRGLGDESQAARTKWFLFASTDQQTLGTGFMRNEDSWKRMGMGPDPGVVIADTRAGLAWRDGPLEASVGYLSREIKPRDQVIDTLDVQTTHESLVAFRISFHPGQR